MSVIFKLDNCTETQRGREMIGRVFALPQTDLWEKYISILPRLCVTHAQLNTGTEWQPQEGGGFSPAFLPCSLCLPCRENIDTALPFSKLKIQSIKTLCLSSSRCIHKSLCWYLSSDFKIIISYSFSCYVVLLSLSFPSPSLSSKNNRVTRLSKHWNRQRTDCFQMHKQPNQETRDKNS